MKQDFDLAIIGSGFSASLLAMIARRIGRSVILLERGAHPRFAIGESTSPLMNLIIEQLAARYDLPRIAPLASYGEWRRAYPDVVRGLKRGFTYFKHEAGRRYRVADGRGNQLLVAASPNDEVADTHWLRADVDHFLLEEALALGAEYLDRTEAHSLDWGANGLARLTGNRAGKPIAVTARLVIDASGPRGALSRMLNLGEAEFDGYPRTQALYSHLTGVRRCDEMPDYAVSDAPPYPMDDAAVHHVFDGGWMWVLRFDNGVTSAGVAVTDELARELRLSDGAPAWRRFLSRFPSIAEQFAEAEAIREFTWMPRLAYRAGTAQGGGWAMLPSAAAFVDPLFSTGMPLALLGVERLGRMLEGNRNPTELSGGGTRDVDGDVGADLCVCPGGVRHIESCLTSPGQTHRSAPTSRPISPLTGLNDRLREYGELTLAEADHTARFIAGCYAAFPRFEAFVAYSMFYFAAASYSEMARRFGRGHLVRRFLAADRAEFASATRRFGDELRATGGDVDPIAFAQRIASAVDGMNIAGLCDLRKRNWYGVDLEDVVAGAAKLGLTALEARQALARMQFEDSSSFAQAIPINSISVRDRP